MPMIALSPEWWSWQKTTCSWWGIANTLVTVATLLIPFRFLVEPGREPAYCVHGVAHPVPGMPEKRGDGLRRVSPHLRAGVGVPRARPVKVGGLRYLCVPPGRVRARRGHVHARRWPMACIRRIRAGELSTRGFGGGISPGVGTAPAGSGRVVARGAGRALGGLRPILGGQVFPTLARCDGK